MDLLFLCEELTYLLSIVCIDLHDNHLALWTVKQPFSKGFGFHGAHPKR